MTYADLASVQATDPGDILTAAWCDQARDNEEFLIDPPACSVKASSAQSVSNSTDTVLNAATETFDNNSMHSTVTNNSRITAQTAGRYLIFATTRFAATSGGARVLHLRVNGGTPQPSSAFVADEDLGTDVVLSAARSFVFAASDYVEVVVFQSTGGSVNVTLEDFTAVFITR